MAANVTIAKDGKRVMQKILLKIQHPTYAKLCQQVWVSTGATPAVEAGASTCAAYPVAVGDLAYRSDENLAYICTVAPAANTAATFVALQA